MHQQTHFNPYRADPFSSKHGAFRSFIKAVLATAFFRCWHIMIFFAGWSTLITLLAHKKIATVTFQPTLLTVIGTVLGFVISYRTTSSFERYNEGRKYWSQIILGSRTLARAVWFHVPDLVPETPDDAGRSEDERRARVIIEKKAFLNLVEAFAVAVKHYLRGEDGIRYDDLYHLVKYLPSYALPAGLPMDHGDDSKSSLSLKRNRSRGGAASSITVEVEPPMKNENGSASSSEPHLPILPGSPLPHQKGPSASDGHLPLPVTEKKKPKKLSFMTPPFSPKAQQQMFSPRSAQSQGISRQSFQEDPRTPVDLLPARMPPKFSVFDVFPFSLLVKSLSKKGKDVSGVKAARYRAQHRGEEGGVVTHNVPLEISFYLTSYVATLNARKSIDVATTNLIINNITTLTDALTGLERILTTPIPFSYSMHLWLVTTIYCLALPSQVFAQLHFLTIPGTVIACFIFFGFLVCGEEIENPFGYDKNDLNLDHFCHNIIRNELIAITARPAPDPKDWAFSPYNDRVLTSWMSEDQCEKVIPEQWVKRGVSDMQTALAVYDR